MQNRELVCRNDELSTKLASIDEMHRNDIRTIRAEDKVEIDFLKEENAFLKEQLRAWKRMCIQTKNE